MKAVVYDGPRGSDLPIYQHFDSRDDGWTKVVLKPSANGASARA
jgi:hypothetical protein